MTGWGTQRVDGGFVVTYDGEVMSDVYPEDRIEARLTNMQERYPNGMAPFAHKARLSREKGVKRGGPYFYVLPKGRKWPIARADEIRGADSEQEARSFLREWLQCQRLPRGTIVTNEPGEAYNKAA